MINPINPFNNNTYQNISFSAPKTNKQLSRENKTQTPEIMSKSTAAALMAAALISFSACDNKTAKQDEESIDLLRQQTPKLQKVITENIQVDWEPQEDITSIKSYMLNKQPPKPIKINLF